MPSLLHEALVALFRNRPSLAPELLREALDIQLPSWSDIRLESAQLSEVIPAEYRADLVVLLLQQQPVLAIVLEVQLHPDDDKRYSWPAYLAGFRARLRCPVMLMVVCPDAAVARWCAEPIHTGHEGWVLRPIVLGPESVPVVTQLQRAKQAPELAVLSVLAHGQGEQGTELAQAALEAVAQLDDERLKFYTDLVWLAIPEAARRALEAMMSSGSYQYQSEFVKRLVRREAELEAKGRVEGEAIGEAKGKAAGKAEAVLQLLQLRGIEVDDETRQVVLGCRDLAQLDRWLGRVMTVGSARELFD
jgi:Arc/MetJ-type ribon-helix-helix transcriptional regulator